MTDEKEEIKLDDLPEMPKEAMKLEKEELSRTYKVGPDGCVYFGEVTIGDFDKRYSARY